MHDSVRDGWAAEVVKYEGRTTWMYQDTRGLLTTGVGNLIDPRSLAMELPWERGDGSLATGKEIEAEWLRLKADASLARKGARAAQAIATLHLSDEAVDELVAAKRDEFWGVLAKRFPGAEEWPAPAQMGILLMAWALGPHFPRTWPRFSAACEAMDWEGAAAECRIPGARDVRNDAHRRLFLAAAEGVE